MPPETEQKLQPTMQPGGSDPSIKPSSEKVIQPLSSHLTAADSLPRSARVTSPDTAIVSDFDPSDTSFKVPTLDLRKQMEEASIKTVAMEHKSLMLLAIAGLLSTIWAVVAAVQLNNAIQKAEIASTNIDSARGGLTILYITILVCTAVYIYLLLAKSRQGVARVLKVLIFFGFISVFGIFWGGAANQGISLFIDGGLLLYTYIVYKIVKTPPTI